MIEKLRDEIIESEKARTELMKWKLILVAAICNSHRASDQGPGLVAIRFLIP